MLEIRQWLPKVAGDFTVFFTDRTGKHEEHYLYTGEIPKEIMDEYQQIIGDGKARVSVGSDMAVKDFGTGAGASVMVSLTCNQDKATVQRAIALAAEMAQNAATYYQQQGAGAAKQLEQQQKTGVPGAPNYSR